MRSMKADLKNSLCLQRDLEAIVDPESADPYDGIATAQNGYRAALLQRHFEVHEEILQLLVPFHAEGDEPVSCLEGAQRERKSNLVSVKTSGP